MASPMTADKTVLIADDVLLVRRICSLILRRHGYQVIEAQDGREAVSKYQERQPDVVLLDLRMPDMDGLAALREIKSVDPSARVVVVTSGSEAEVEEALRAGAGAFVLKPFNQVRILRAVQTVLPTPGRELVAVAE